MAAPTPCAGLAGPVGALAERLPATRDRGGIARVAQDAAALADAGTPAERACAAYTAGSAWFFLSAQGADRRYHAAAAVAGLLRAQSLDPVAMAERQPVSRLREAWARVGPVPGWLDGARGPVAVTLPARAGRVRLGPADPAAWRLACGATPSCAEAAEVAFDLRPDASGELALRPGQYAIALTTACGTTRIAAAVEGGALPLPPDPPCPVRLAVRDGERPVPDARLVGPDGAPRALDDLRADQGPVTVSAPGFAPRTVDLLPGGGDQSVPLARCVVDLRVATQPPGAEVEGAGPAPWGRRAVRVRHPGYVDQVVQVEVPPPARCDDARHDVGVELARPVIVVGHDGDDRFVLPARLWIQGDEVAITGFGRPPGRYGFQADHPRLGTTIGVLTVDACAGARCPPVRLDARFERALDPGAGPGPWILAGGGGLAVVAGIVFGSLALGADQDLRTYTVRREEAKSVAELVDERDRWAGAADLSLGLGATAAVGGLLWYLWETQ
ncbi:MAG: hypothetical protein H6706_11040 [Myxococcales bacterium]|nr:hypothetical protein [Myxococcales bacterium]